MQFATDLNLTILSLCTQKVFQKPGSKPSQCHSAGDQQKACKVELRRGGQTGGRKKEGKEKETEGWEEGGDGGGQLSWLR